MSPFIRPLTSRGYEMDARHVISASNLARYFEHARWEAIVADAFGLRGLFSGGLKFVVRAQDLVVEQQVLQGQALVLALTLAHVGRTSFTLRQTLSAAGEATPHVRCTMTAVAVDANFRAAAVPEGLRAHAVGPAPETLTLPSPNDAPDSAFVHTFQVRPSDLDALQHVNQSRYVELVDDARELAIIQGALSGPRGGSPRRISVEYLRETKLGQDLTVTLWPLTPDQRVVGCILRHAGASEVCARARLER